MRPNGKRRTGKVIGNVAWSFGTCDHSTKVSVLRSPHSVRFLRAAAASTTSASNLRTAQCNGVCVCECFFSASRLCECVCEAFPGRYSIETSLANRTYERQICEGILYNMHEICIGFAALPAKTTAWNAYMHIYCTLCVV